MDHSPGFLAHVEGRRPHVHEVSIPETLATLQATPAAVLIDVREDREWNAGHATAATHVARGVIERDIEMAVQHERAGDRQMDAGQHVLARP